MRNLLLGLLSMLLVPWSVAQVGNNCQTCSIPGGCVQGSAWCQCSYINNTCEGTHCTRSCRGAAAKGLDGSEPLTDAITGHPWVRSSDLVSQVQQFDPDIAIVLDSTQQFLLANPKICGEVVEFKHTSPHGLITGTYNSKTETFLFKQPLANHGSRTVTLKTESDFWRISVDGVSERSGIFR